VNEERRGPWYLLTGLIFGIVLGLVYAWVISPVQFTDAAPSSLRPEFKDAYRSLIAQAYLANQDIGRARGRLELLKDGKIAYELGAQAQRVVSAGGSPLEARALAQLAADLDRYRSGQVPVSQNATPGTSMPAQTLQSSAAAPTATLDEAQMILTATQAPTATSTPQATFTPRAQTNLQPKLSAPLVLKGRKEVCSADLPEGLLMVDVNDKDGKPIAGVRVDVTWDGGQDSFYTGLYPELSLGYADFAMKPNTKYSLRAGDGGEVVNDITPGQCTGSDGKTFLGGVRVVFGN
jgi:hypothetical protein